MDAKNSEVLHNQDLMRAVKYLYRTERINNDKDIVEATGYAKNTVSGYIKGKILASEKFRTKFEEVYNLNLADYNEPMSEQRIIIDECSPSYFAGKLAGKDDVIAQIEARRLDAIAMAEKFESHYQDMKAALERAQITINEVLKPIQAQTIEILANSKKAQEGLLSLKTEMVAEHGEMMETMDQIAGNEPGTTAAKAGIVELAHRVHKNQKGKKANLDKNS